MAFVVLIGASGSGKTTIAREVERCFARDTRVFYFDHIGVPPTGEMIAEFGSGEEWQRVKTIEWMKRLAKVATAGRVLFEGQTRLTFLEEGAIAAGNLRYLPVLVDCDDATREKRLVGERQQPGLANTNMMNWASYLRHQAKERGCQILDTSKLSLEQSVSYVMTSLSQNS